MKTKLLPLLLVLLAGSAIAAGCGNKDSNQEETGANAPITKDQSVPPTDETSSTPEGESSESGEQLEVSADPGGALKFEKDSLEAKAGRVTITMPNPSPVPHAIGVRGEGGAVDETGETVTKDGESMVSVELKPGEYEFYCPVAGHEAGGMKGTLTVK